MVKLFLTPGVGRIFRDSKYDKFLVLIALSLLVPEFWIDWQRVSELAVAVGHRSRMGMTART